MRSMVTVESSDLEKVDGCGSSETTRRNLETKAQPTRGWTVPTLALTRYFLFAANERKRTRTPKTQDPRLCRLHRHTREHTERWIHPRRLFLNTFAFIGIYLRLNFLPAVFTRYFPVDRSLPPRQSPPVRSIWPRSFSNPPGVWIATSQRSSASLRRSELAPTAGY